MTKVILELTEKEAKALYLFTGKIAGDPRKSYRKYSDSIYNKITDLVDTTNIYSGSRKITGTINCGDYPMDEEIEDEEPNSSKVVPDKSMRIPRVSIGE